MEEKRKCKRFNIASFAETEVYASIINGGSNELNRDQYIPQSFFIVYEQNTENVVGYLLDISVKGLMIIGEILFTQDKVYQFYLNFTELLGYEQQTPFDLRCAWINSTANSEYFIAGFELIKAEQEHIQMIKQLIEQFEPYADHRPENTNV